MTGAQCQDATGLLAARYGDRWEIRHDRPGIWTAERTEGTAIRFIVATTSAGLAAKLAEAERTEQS